MATHYVARELVALGHNVKQVLATHAKSFRQRHKNDFQDAHAVADSACLVPNLSEEGVDPELESTRMLAARNSAVASADGLAIE